MHGEEISKQVFFQLNKKGYACVRSGQVFINKKIGVQNFILINFLIGLTFWEQNDVPTLDASLDILVMMNLFRVAQWIDNHIFAVLKI